MSDNLLQRIQQAQVEAGENAVVADLRRKGLLPPMRQAIVIPLSRMYELIDKYVAERCEGDGNARLAMQLPLVNWIEWLRGREERIDGESGSDE